MELGEIKSGEPDFKGNASVAAWIKSDDNGSRYLVVEIGNSSSIGGQATLILKQRNAEKKAE